MMHGTIKTTADIDELASQITSAWQKATASIIETGRLLIEAKKKVGHGSWLDLVAKLPFSDRTADHLMKIARHPVLSHPTHLSNLPPSWGTLHRLTALPDRELKQLLQNGTINCETQRDEADKLVERVRDDGLYQYSRIPELLKTRIRFMEKYPDPPDLAREMFVNYMLGHFADDLSDLAKLLRWLTKFKLECRQELEAVNFEEEDHKRAAQRKALMCGDETTTAAALSGRGFAQDRARPPFASIRLLCRTDRVGEDSARRRVLAPSGRRARGRARAPRRNPRANF
jgi:hypothetical protein